MRFIHTADWHLGRLFHGTHLTDDQRHVLLQLVELAKGEKVDAVLIAGDIYDRAVPPPEAVDLLDEILSKLVLEAKVPVVLIAGNHDSPNRLSFGAKLMRQRRLYVSGCLAPECRAVELSDEAGRVNLYALPYAEPALVRHCLGNEAVVDHDSAMRALAKRIQANHPQGERSILLGHAFVVGGERSESERPLSVGGAESVSAECFAGFDYVALGHLHGPQEIRCGNGQGKTTIRYSGSLLKYSFDECDHKKGVYLVEMDAAGNCQAQRVELSARRDVRRIEGLMKELLAGISDGKSRDDYLDALVTDDGPVLDAIGRLRQVYPNVMQIRRPKMNGSAESDRPDVRKLDELALFGAFYHHVAGAELSPGQRGAFAEVVEGMRAREREGSGEGTGRKGEVVNEAH